MSKGLAGAVLLAFASTVVSLPCLQAQERSGKPAEPVPAIEAKTRSMMKLDGYFPLYWDEHEGSLWLEIPRFGTDFLYATGLAAGLGSNDIGLDRGIEGNAAIVYFERTGPKVFLVQRNENYRSSSRNPAERKSVEESFATSILKGFTVAAESNGRVLVNATDFFLRDQYGAGAALHPGKYRVDDSRSAIYLPGTMAFPKNTEVEVTLTFAQEADQEFDPGFPAQGPPAIGRGGGRASLVNSEMSSGTVASVTPDVEAVTLREHYSLVELPDDHFKRRLYDPRAGYDSNTFADYSVPVGEPIRSEEHTSELQSRPHL